MIKTLYAFLLPFILLCNFMGTAQAVNDNSGGHFLFNLNFVWHRPVDGQLEYVIKASEPDNDVPIGNYRSIDPNYSTHFSIDVGWLSGCNKSDILLKYKRLHESKGSSIFTEEDNDLFATDGHPEWAVFDNIENPEEASARVRYELDTLALEFGHFIQASDYLQLHFVGGLNYADVERDFFIRYAGGDLDNADGNGGADNVADIRSYSRFHGIGLSGGIDGQYALGEGFSVFEEFRAAFLIGDIKLYSEGFSGAEFPEDSYETKSKSKGMVVSNLNARLGGAYDYDFGGFNLKILAGYQIDKYFNVIANQRFIGYPDSIGIFIDGEYDGLSFKQFHNLSFNGPFIQFSMKF